MALPGISGGKIATTANEYGPSSVNSGLGSIGGIAGGIIDALTPKASEIFEKRSVTRIWTSHQEIALQNIGGSLTTDFSENENLYGFSIFRFTKGLFGGGWANANINSLLAMDIGGMLGEDELGKANSYFFNLHPKSINLSEPFATHLVPTQGGGIYSESQGIILRTLSITGTTGYRPSKTHEVSTRKDGTIPWTPDEPTGYMNFLKLRNVFRNYADLKKAGGSAQQVYMVWFNNREQEAWFFEPTNFVTNRDASSPFTYTYQISGTLIQKVNFSTVVNTIHPDPTSPHAQIAAMRRSASLLNGFVSNFLPALGDDVVGDVMQVTKVLLDYVDAVDTTVTQLLNTGQGLATLPALIGEVLGSSISAVSSAIVDVIDKQKEIWGAATEGVLDKNPFVTSYFDRHDKIVSAAHAVDEIRRTIVGLGQPEAAAQMSPPSSVADKNDDLPGTNTRRGALTDGDAGSGYFSDEYQWPGIPIGDSSVDIYDLVASIVGDPFAVSAVIAYNGLDYPYITGTPTYQKGNHKVLNEGDIIYLPFPKEVISGDINTKINPLKASMSLGEESLGRDIRLTKSTQGTTGVSEFNLTISPNGDLDLIEGSDNIKQAIDIKLHTERGELTIHPEFGLVSILGRKGSRSLNFDLYLSLNDTMLSDGRIKELVGTRVSTRGDVVAVKTKVYVIGHVPYVPLSFTVGG